MSFFFSIFHLKFLRTRFLIPVFLYTIVALSAFADNPLFPPHFGPIYDKFKLTLTGGTRTEIAGPLVGIEDRNPQKLFTLSPALSYFRDPQIPQTEIDFVYPILTWDHFGQEYRFQIFQVFAFSGGNTQTNLAKRRFTLFPIYFQQRSPNPEDNYTAVLPFYGHLKNRLFRDEVFFIMLPLYLQSRKRDVVTDNYLFPFVHRRHGNGLRGWQVWPITGKETKQVTTRTNSFDEVETIPGHEKFFALWPFYFNNTLGIGSTNVEKQFVLLPFYSRQHSPARETTTYGFPIGFTHVIEREKKYEEWGAPWPIVDIAKGEGKTTHRVWPFFSRAKTPTLESDFYLWPVYKYNRALAEPLDRERTRILLFLYSDLSEKNTVKKTAFQRRDLWPFFTWRKEHNGNERLQVLSILEPIIPNNKSIERLYSPVWSIWRSDKNAKPNEKSQSLLWNLYRADASPERIKHTALFGLLQRERTEHRTQWRLFYIPFTTHRAGAQPTSDLKNPPATPNIPAK